MTVAVPGRSGIGAAGGVGGTGLDETASRRRGAEAWGAWAGVAAGAAGRGRGVRKLVAVRAGCDGAARPDRPRRCTLPITALRVTPPPNCLAIWLADWPSSQSFFSAPTRSSVQPAVMPPSASLDSISRSRLPLRGLDLPLIVNQPLRDARCANQPSTETRY